MYSLSNLPEPLSTTKAATSSSHIITVLVVGAKCVALSRFRQSNGNLNPSLVYIEVEPRSSRRNISPWDVYALIRKCVFVKLHFFIKGFLSKKKK